MAKMPERSRKGASARGKQLATVQAAEAVIPFGGPRPQPGAVTEVSPGRPVPPLTPVRMLNTTRLLPARYSDSVLTRIADTDDDLQQIYALDNATNERLLAEQNLRLGITIRELVFHVPNQRIINAAFTHPHPLGARFSTPFRGAWYAGADLASAKAEVLFHRLLQFAEIAWNEREALDYDQYLADFTGEFHDLRPQAFARMAHEGDAEPNTPGPSFDSFRACLDPASYMASQLLSIDLLAADSLGIVYPSTRRPSGTCIACFRPSLVGNVRKRDLFRLTWHPDRGPSFVRAERASPGKPTIAEN